jgi:hypothetical protein
MGEYSWLRHVLSETEINMEVASFGIECSGSTWTAQTQQNEYFSFVIPYEELS